jgi:Zn-dependent peptidase ImmA (M78 family)/DNA-binding XRE family transcriptional regulator
MTLVELGNQVGVSSQSISNYEHDRQQPSPQTLERIAAVLDFPLSFFSAPEIDEIDPASVSFRARSKISAYIRDAALSESRMAVEFSHWMDAFFKLPTPDIPTPGRKMAPELNAEYLRSAWRMGESESIRNMIHLVEAHGVRVFSLAPEYKEVDAFSFWRDRQPYIFLNTLKSAARSRFDVAHELGHLMMHCDDEAGVRTRAAEKEADAFASSFLMPRRSISARVPQSPTTDQIIRLKKNWNVSALALTYRLHSLGRITEWQYRQTVIELGRLGFRTAEPGDAPRESSMLLQKVFSGLWEDGVLPHHIARQLNASISELNSWVFGLMAVPVVKRAEDSDSTAPRLRLVK